MTRFRIFFALFALILAPLAHAQAEKFTPDELDFIDATWPSAKKTMTGIRYIIEREGHGAQPVAGDVVSVLYVGKLFDGKVFDKNQDILHPFSFRVRRFQVIEGWDQVLQLMKPGEKRLVIIPAELAYGTRGQSPIIKPDAPLVFEIELISVKKDE
jgi:FKBP-type peptidyl-prolyl cis-trans isomerase